MDLIGCWFGEMLVFHGAGGLAGQYWFDARSSASVVFLGLGILAGLVLGNFFVRILICRVLGGLDYWQDWYLEILL